MELKDLHRLFAKLFLLIALILFSVPRTTSAMPEIFPFEQLRSGMSGKAYTVVDGSGKIENFDVNIIGLTDEGKGAKRVIMARASGEVIQRTGGILQGMSGSPVYIDGKLVGALAAIFKEMDPYAVLITPIENMIELWNLPDPKAQVNRVKVIRKIEEENKIDEPKAEEKSSVAEVEEKSAEFVDKTKVAEPEAEEVEAEEVGAFYVSGFDGGGMNFLQRELGLKKLQNPPLVVERGIQLDATLEPGSAMGVAIIYGDFSLGATGTVTAVDGKRVLAFGHSFMHAGNVNYFMTDASVIGSVSGATSGGIKVAGIGHIIGRINQDRDSGIAGILGTFPAVVPINVTVKDIALGKQETYNATIAYNENLVPKLGASIAYAALSKMADSLAESTVEVDFNVKTNAVDGGELTRKNMFYNPSDVGQVAVLELMQALNLVCSNTKEESNIFGVDVNISLDTERRTASIVSVTPDKKIVKPGETINLTVELQPYRKPTEKVVMPYTVPLTARQGNLALEIHGGALVPVNQAMANAGIITAESNKSYEEKIKDFLKTGKNNQLVVEVGGSNEPKTEKQIRQEIAQAKRAKARLKKEGKTSQKVDSKVDTNYIIDNVMRTTLSVEKV
ncbi:MAG: SpoIVB peptidase S55 domain protein [Selenomonadaceae bacterium]|nr:SpoIVB peptidase S55 domain protein [Selenomonadaceae bacterium]